MLLEQLLGGSMPCRQVLLPLLLLLLLLLLLPLLLQVLVLLGLPLLAGHGRATRSRAAAS